MNKKIIVFLIIIFILFLIAGGIFLFFRKANILGNNPFLASIAGLKTPSILSESDLLPLKEKIVFLEEKLEERESELEYLDDLTEKVGLLNQRVIELEAEFEEVQVNLVLAEAEKETEEELEEEKIEEEEEKEDKEEKEKKEAEKGELAVQIPCQIISGVSSERDKIILNEIAWMGTTTSASDEWIELKNISGSAVNLSGWQILDKNQDIKIFFGEQDKIPSNDFFLLERTDDETLPNIKADKIYSGALANENEGLYLFDENCQLQDKVETGSGWPAGDNSSKRTMERKADFSWQTSKDIGGTPGTQNSSGYVEPTGGISSPSLPPTPPPSYPQILITEIQIAGEGDEKEEFVELYNPNENNVDLTSWYLQRKTKTGADYSTFAPSTLFAGKQINTKDYFLIARQDSSFEALADVITTHALTEDNTLALKNPNREIVDKVGWGEAQEFETAPSENPEAGKSLGRIWNSETQEYQDTDDNSVDFEIQNPTPKAENQSPAPPPQDLTSPQIAFDLSSSQIALTFSISFEITDNAATSTPSSGLDGFTFRRKEEDGEWQEDNYQEIEGDVDTFDGERQFEGEDGKTYYFQIKAKDKSDNESEWLPDPPAFTKIEIEQQEENGCLPEQININTASEEDLVKIIHIGPIRAQEIISLRPFSSLEDLVRVNGISESRLVDIKEEGLACFE